MPAPPTVADVMDRQSNIEIHAETAAAVADQHGIDRDTAVYACIGDTDTYHDDVSQLMDVPSEPYDWQ